MHKHRIDHDVKSNHLSKLHLFRWNCKESTGYFQGLRVTMFLILCMTTKVGHGNMAWDSHTIIEWILQFQWSVIFPAKHYFILQKFNFHFNGHFNFARPTDLYNLWINDHINPLVLSYTNTMIEWSPTQSNLQNFDNIAWDSGNNCAGDRFANL